MRICIKANRRYGKPPYAAVCLLESGGIRGNMLTRRFAFPLYRTNFVPLEEAGVKKEKEKSRKTACSVRHFLIIYSHGVLP